MSKKNKFQGFEVRLQSLKTDTAIDQNVIFDNDCIPA